MNSILSNPKRDTSSKNGKAGFYDYYASFSPSFVRDTLSFLDLKKDSRILDPWNGSGTTTQVAQEMGYSTIGYDINPVMVIVAKSKKTDPDLAVSLHTLCLEIINKAKRYRKVSQTDHEPLETWFYPETAGVIRKLERAIQHLLISETYSLLLAGAALKPISSLAAFFYVALFRSLRDLANPFFCTNPTWIKKPKQKEERVLAPADLIYHLFQHYVQEMANLLGQSQRINSRCASKSILALADSQEIPLPNESIQAVISSPPYCTRIDYTVATSLELALLGCAKQTDVKRLREKTIGSPVIRKEDLIIQENWGAVCLDTLEKIRLHAAKASQSYYYKTYTQYFTSVYQSLQEISRVLRNDGSCVLVVQDSYYKDIHVNLAAIIEQMGQTLTWQLALQEDFPTKQNMAGLNSRSAHYRKTTMATESVLIFNKKGGGV
ncbi:hypothetical protein Dhaf_0642 [Desulfitobacterium hafniense DCB-2]|uniref:DNA methylase n=2 Tax=Desulfitobacterium hafniense TaxID=49338 RepID=A0A098AX31_DESHA|nr:DNA methyltransferase [Desulfitobacterium hafniense]ACL18707.1 hypothetical protein Dhaf_0642 [Desulfitobacterium hafniense DCB-2]CDX00677.1 DNA methylase [Desulfitobacterium hafniense]